jgi:hypothetical protein
MPGMSPEGCYGAFVCYLRTLMPVRMSPNTRFGGALQRSEGLCRGSHSVRSIDTNGSKDSTVFIEVRTATPDRWSDVVTAFGRRGVNPSWCWCRRFLNEAEPDGNNRDALRKEIADAIAPPGLLAYVDERPIGWTRVGPRSGFPGVSGNRAS